MKIYAYHPQNVSLKGPYDITNVGEEPVRRLAKQFHHSLYFFVEEEPEPETEVIHLSSDGNVTWCGEYVEPGEPSETAPMCRNCANDLMGEFLGNREALANIARALDDACRTSDEREEARRG